MFDLDQLMIFGAGEDHVGLHFEAILDWPTGGSGYNTPEHMVATIDTHSVPEPATLTLLAGGLIAAAAFRKRLK